MIARNPVRGLERDERPKIGGGEKRVLDEAEIRRLLEAAGPSRTLFALFIFSGLRLGETLGLRWADLDFEGRFIRVRAQLNPKRGLDPMPKTDAGRRDIVLVPQLEKLLKAHRLASPFSGDDDFVFPAPDGRGQDHRAVGRKIERAVKKAELGEGISAHAFRHTFASLLIVGLKLDPVNVAAQLEHSNPNVTVGTYSHLFDKARAADSMPNRTRRRLRTPSRGLELTFAVDIPA